MKPPANLSPDHDPYFAATVGKAVGKFAATPGGNEATRRDLPQAEVAARVAGTAAMLLGAAVFVTFAVPVARMLREAGEPGGLLLDEEWLRRRWAARMASVLLVSLLAVALGWGLRRGRPWARPGLLVLAAIAPAAVGVALGLALGDGAAARVRAEVAGLAVLCGLAVAAGLVAGWALYARRARAGSALGYRPMIAHESRPAGRSGAGLAAGVILAGAMLVLFWAAVFGVLGILAACGGIRSI